MSPHGQSSTQIQRSPSQTGVLLVQYGESGTQFGGGAKSSQPHGSSVQTSVPSSMHVHELQPSCAGTIAPT
jgi:hypothetical protein